MPNVAPGGKTSGLGRPVSCHALCPVPLPQDTQCVSSLGGRRSHWYLYGLSSSHCNALFERAHPWGVGVVARCHQFDNPPHRGILPKRTHHALASFQVGLTPGAVPVADDRFSATFKLAGWHIDESALHHDFTRERLLILLSLNYLWATDLGRWLCETGARAEIDNSRPRRYSLFRIGLDWMVHRYVLDQSIPSRLTLYA